MADMRLIDAAPLIEYFSGGEAMKSLAESVSDARFVEALKNAPTIDAVPVVRCKDCKYIRPEVYAETHDIAGYWCGFHDMGDIDADGFCNYGERERRCD